MKKLKDYIGESLIKSYPYKKLIQKLKELYKDKIDNDIFYYNSKSKENKTFQINFDNDDIESILYNHALYKNLEFFGYYITKCFNNIKTNKLSLIIEPIFSEKCNDYVINECGGILYYITSKQNYDKKISYKGLVPREGDDKKYRFFTERIFLYGGKSKKDILENTKKILDQINNYNYVILKIDVNRLNIDWYRDSHQEDIILDSFYCNAIIHTNYIEEIGKYEDLENIIKEGRWTLLPNNQRIFIETIH